MPWPSINDFSDAIQNPAACFRDGELLQSNPQTNSRGMPQVYSGEFAAVYPVISSGRRFAVRCFTKEVKDQHKRYTDLDRYLRSTLPPAFVDFEFHQQGIRVQGNWYPIVKMEWVNGLPLDQYIRQNLNSPAQIQRSAARWRGAASDLQSRAIAHNDLQHGNVMVENNGAIRLVDYDSIYLPQYQGEKSPEEGHPNFQHPKRTMNDYNELTDNFSAIVIYLSILALAEDPGLWQSFNDSNNLIFTKRDYDNPAGSECFRKLKNSREEAVRNLAGYLEECCQSPLEKIPYLENVPYLRNGESPHPATATAPVPQQHPPPAAAAGRTGSLSYRDILRQRAEEGQDPGTAYVERTVQPSAPPQQMPPTVSCPQCGKANPDNLVYCTGERCQASLHPGVKYCTYCGFQGPEKAAFCHNCGKKTG